MLTKTQQLDWLYNQKNSLESEIEKQKEIIKYQKSFDYNKNEAYLDFLENELKIVNDQIEDI